MVRTEVQSLVRELRSYKLHGAARKKKKKKENLFISGRGNDEFKGPEEGICLQSSEASAGSVVSKEAVRKAALWFSIMCDGNLLEGFKKRNDMGRHRSK